MNNNSTLVFCPRCGAATTPDVCDNCGYVFEEYTQEEVEEFEEVIETVKVKPRKNYSILIASIIVVVTIVLLILIFIVCSGGLFFLIFDPVAYFANTNNNITNIQTDIEGDDPDDPDDPDVDPDDKDDDDKDDDDKDDKNDEEEYYDNVTGYSELVLEFDYDDLQTYLDDASEFTDNYADTKNDIFVYGGYSTSDLISHDSIDRDSFPTPYYDPIIETYVECDDYSIERHIVKYDDEVDGVLVTCDCAYYEIVSDKIDFTAANECLKKKAMQDVYRYLENSNKNSDIYNYKFYVDSAITYNDDNLISIICDVASYETNYRDEILLYGINIDAKTGEVMDNNKIINVDEDFAKFFKDRCTCQMGAHDYVNNLSDQEIVKLLTNPQSLIVYFSPLGIEIGYQYKYQSGKGWITCTINDYDKYLSGVYQFDTSFSKKYDVFSYEKQYGTYNQQHGLDDPLAGYYDSYDDF